MDPEVLEIIHTVEGVEGVGGPGGGEAAVGAWLAVGGGEVVGEVERGEGEGEGCVL